MPAPALLDADVAPAPATAEPVLTLPQSNGAAPPHGAAPVAAATWAATEPVFDSILDEIRFTFGEEHADRWLQAPNHLLGGCTPQELIGTEQEFLVQDLLVHMHYGIPS